MKKWIIFASLILFSSASLAAGNHTQDTPPLYGNEHSASEETDRDLHTGNDALLIDPAFVSMPTKSAPVRRLSASAPVRTSGYDHVTETDMDSIFSVYDRPDNPGCAVGVSSIGNPIFAKGYGSANLDYGIPIRPDSRFMIASISKQFAAASVLMMAQEGLLDLDEDLRTYIPELPEFDKPITARQIIHHTSGLRDIYNLLSLADIGLDNTTTKEEALAMLGRQQRLNFEPGSEHLYSNSGYFLISVLSEKVTGMPLREYTQKHFFDPIGMTDTHWHDITEMIVPNRVISYLPTSRGPGQFYRGNMDRIGARGLFTTIEDFAKWDANFIENRSNLENFAEIMTRPGSTHRRDSINYAAGLRLGRYKDIETVGHGGSYMGFRTSYMRFPAHDFSVMVFCNHSDISPATHARQVADLYLRDAFSERFAEYLAEYRSESLEVAFDVFLEDGDLYLQRHDEEPRRLIWSEEDRFRTGQWDLRFERDDNEDIDRFILEAPRTGKITFRRE
ncbi:MAG: serine hydrolase domain-containing protein [Cyclonatronaceae bacterium]